MIFMKRIINVCLVMFLCLVISVCASSTPKTKNEPKTEKDIVLEKIDRIGKEEYMIWKINNNKLKYSSITVTTLEKTADDLYTAYGKIRFVDVYDDSYERNVELSLKKEISGAWKLYSIDIDGFEYEMLHRYP